MGQTPYTNLPSQPATCNTTSTSNKIQSDVMIHLKKTSYQEHANNSNLKTNTHLSMAVAKDENIKFGSS
jgi:hypothetical protein